MNNACERMTVRCPGRTVVRCGSKTVSMPTVTLAALLVAVLTCLSAALAAETLREGFDGNAVPGAWRVRGDVTVDAARDRGSGGGSLKVAPAGEAIWPVRKADGSGRVEMWVYDDQTKPANPRTRRVGPRWGLMQADGRVLVMGVIYAPYLAGATTYASSDSDRKNWFHVQYSAVKRTKGWHRWTFDFDADKGLTIHHDGNVLPTRRFDWNKTKIAGFTGVAIFGDSGKGAGQTIWVDDVQITPGPPMRAKPTPPPPPPPVVPKADPVVENAPQLAEAVRDVHPRLLFDPDDIPKLRAFARGAGKEFFGTPRTADADPTGLLAYLEASTVPKAPTFLRDATDGQRQGLWRMPTVGLHYVLTGDKRSLATCKGFLQMLLDLPHWETGKELDSGMSAGNIMIGAGLLFDWTYHDLDPDFREKVRRKLIYHARAMVHGGHLNKNKATGYWQNETHNNHRWHRDAGWACALLAAYNGRKEDGWILQKLYDELALVAKWLPEDGTTHESSSYLIFGAAHLTLAMQAGDRCFGTRHLRLPFFRNMPRFRLHILTPGMTDAFHFGDSGGLGSYNNLLYKCTAVHKRKDLHAAVRLLHKRNPKAFWLDWMSLVWIDPALAGGSADSLANTAFFGDIGLATMRSGWGADDVGAMFKCGPFGGHTLNRFRNARDYQYINVAHDDPDANSFLLFGGGSLLAETSRYSKHKASANHNTILVNGMGQMSHGRPEGGVWSQPATGKTDMRTMGVVTAFHDAGDVVIVEGEAAGSYLACRDRRTGRSRPALDRYRRTFIWVKGAYVLVLDDIRAPQPVEIAWLMQGPTLTALDGAPNRYVLAKGRARCEFRVVTHGAQMAPRIVPSPADARGRRLGWQQLRLTGTTDRLRVVSLYNLWSRKDLNLQFEPDASPAATVSVTGTDLQDQWHWPEATGRFVPTALVGRRKSGTKIALTPKDQPAEVPRPE